MKEGPDKRISRRNILAGLGALAVGATVGLPEAEARNLTPEESAVLYISVKGLTKNVLQRSVEYFGFINTKSNTETGEYSRLFVAALNDENIPESEDTRLRGRLQDIFTDWGSSNKNYYIAATGLRGLLQMIRRRATVFVRLEDDERIQNEDFLRYLSDAEARLDAIELEENKLAP